MGRTLLISLFFAALFLLPALSEQLDFTLPLARYIAIPATGLEYMAVFFHELGHTAALWSFGYPALPSFDFQQGGGLSYGFERSMALQGLFYAALLLLLLYLWRKEDRFLFKVILIPALAHLTLSFNAGHEIAWLYMGHGAEILIGSFCLLRVIFVTTEGGNAERCLNGTFGFFVMGRNMLLAAGLAFDDISRMAYEAQKGGHGFGDFSRITDIAGASLVSVALMHMSLTLMLFLGALTLARRSLSSFSS